MREKLITEILHTINGMMDEIDFTESPNLMRVYNEIQVIRDGLQREGGWNRPRQDINPCRCGNDWDNEYPFEGERLNGQTHIRVVCPCGESGPWEDDEKDAIESWNMQW